MKTVSTTSQSLIPLLKTVLLRFIRDNVTHTTEDLFKYFEYEYNGLRRYAHLLHGNGFAELYVEFDGKEKSMKFWSDDSEDYILNESKRFRAMLSNPNNVLKIAEMLAERIISWEIELEGFIQFLEIQEGTTRIDKLIVDPNLKRDNTPTDASVFSLEKHNHIGRLVIPKSVINADYECFSFFAGMEGIPFVYAGRTKYKRIRIDSIINHSHHLLVEDGVLYSADKTKLIYCFKEKTEFVVPLSVIKICSYAFCGQHKLEKITLPNSLQEIGCNAFMDCIKLREVCLPNGIVEIKSHTFDNCLSLVKIVLPNGVKTLGNDAFRHCESVKSIDLSDSIEQMCSFECCYSLKEITVPPKVKDVEGFMFCHSLRNVQLQKGVKRISGYAFRYCENLGKINFPEGLREIGDRAFMPNDKLTEVDFPSTLREIGIEAFYQCKKLHSVRFAAEVKTIKQAAFACTSLLLRIYKPSGMVISKAVIKQDKDLDKWGFWD